MIGYKYCLYCGSKYCDQQNPQKLTCSVCGSIFYLNSKPTASVIITRDKQVLLGRRKIEPSKGEWDVIGGFLNLGEKPEGGARREAKEETGLSVELEDMLGFFMDSYGTTGEKTLNICYTAKVLGGTQMPGDDIEELRWFSHNDLPKRIAFKNGEEMLKAWVKRLKKQLELLPGSTADIIPPRYSI